MSEDAPEREYEIGYGKPPVASRFLPGQSGNPRGRQKGSKNGMALLKAELEAPVVLTENNKRVKTTKLGLIIKQVIKKAATKGDVKDFIALSKHYGSDETAPKTGDDEAVLEGEDAQTYESFLKRVKGGVS